MRIIIEEDPNRPGEGCARLLVQGMAGQDVPAVTFTREGFGADSLGADGWQVAAGRLAPIEVTSEGEHLAIVLGPEAAEHLQAGPVRLGIPSLGFDQVVIWPDIPPALADRRGGFGANRPGTTAPRRAPPRATPPAPKPADDATLIRRATPAPTPAPAPKPVAPPPPPSPPAAVVADPATPKPGAGAPLLILLLLLALAGAGAAAWWFWPSAEPAPAPLAAIATPATPTPAPTPPPVAAVDRTEGATPAEIAAMALPPARVMEIAARRAATNRAQDALLLLELAAEARHGPAFTALARLYDPASFQRGGALSAPNAIKAAELWRDAERAGDAAATAPRAALRQRLQDAARGGDTLADLALRDFWP